MTAHYQVHEMFHSIQGEGVRAGITSCFVRLQGCPVGCEWCDAKLTWYAGGERRDVDEIMAFVRQQPCEQVVITGGEPLIYNLDPLLTELEQNGYSTQIETSGAVPMLGLAFPTFLTVSPKYRLDFYADRELVAAAYELKYVVDEHFRPGIVSHHLRYVVGYQERRTAGELPIPHIVLMPEGSPPRDEMIKLTFDYLRHNPTWRFGARLQYAYPEIAALEGDTNKIVSDEYAREVAQQHVRERYSHHSG